MEITSTRVHDVASALVAVAASTLTEVTVDDGPTAATMEPVDRLVVGVGNAEDADPYRTTRDGFDLGGRSKESGVVRCQMSTWSGDTDLGALRGVLAGWMSDLEDAFRADQHLSATCDLVRLGSARWYHLQGVEGAGVGVHFDVTYEAWL
jgi:hypothetical protein